MNSLLALFLLTLLYSNAEKCPVFGCLGKYDSFELKNDDDSLMGQKTCVKIKNSAMIHASKCSTGYECSAGWLHPSQATDDAHCMKYDDKPLLNYTVPGDY